MEAYKVTEEQKNETLAMLSLLLAKLNKSDNNNALIYKSALSDDEYNRITLNLNDAIKSEKTKQKILSIGLSLIKIAAKTVLSRFVPTEIISALISVTGDSNTASSIFNNIKDVLEGDTQ